MRERIEAIQAQMRELEAHRFETAHGVFWADYKSEADWHVLKERLTELQQQRGKESVK